MTRADAFGSSISHVWGIDRGNGKPSCDGQRYLERFSESKEVKVSSRQSSVKEAAMDTSYTPEFCSFSPTVPTEYEHRALELSSIQ